MGYNGCWVLDGMDTWGWRTEGRGGGGCGGGAAFLALVHTRKCRDSQAGRQAAFFSVTLWYFV